jgi:hypothetical protein
MGRFWVPNEAEVNFLTQVFQSTFQLTFRLFKSLTVVADDTTYLDFTEADYPGYSAQTVSAITPFSADSFAGLTNPKGFTGTYSCIFPGNSGSDQTVYGVYITYLNPLTDVELLGAANVFDANPTLALVGKTVSGSTDVVPIVFNLRLWDFFTGNPAIPVGEHFTLWTNNYTPDTGTDWLVGVADRLGDEMANLAGTRTVHFTSTDPSATMPADLDLTANGGSSTTTATWITSGSQQLTATDTVDGTIIGKISVVVQGG